MTQLEETARPGMALPTCVLHVGSRPDLAARSHPHSSCCHKRVRQPTPRPTPVRWALARTRCVPWPFNVCRNGHRSHRPTRRTCAAAVTPRACFGTARHGTGRAVKGARLARAVDEVIRELTILYIAVWVLGSLGESQQKWECNLYCVPCSGFICQTLDKPIREIASTICACMGSELVLAMGTRKWAWCSDWPSPFVYCFET